MECNAGTGSSLKSQYPRPRRRFGQNFLHDPALAGRIADAARVAPGEVVVELGPGRGILTGALVERGARVVAIEIDTDLAERLEARWPGSEVEVIRGDLAAMRLEEIVAPRGLDRVTLVGNIPYNLTREVFFRYLVDGRRRVRHAVIMVQREVGERVAAPPGSRTYGVTSVLLQRLYRVRAVLRVGAGAFVPRPRVDSVVVAFEPREDAEMPDEAFERFRAVVRGVFGQRRKTMLNAVRRVAGLDEAGAREALERAGIAPQARPETLDDATFEALSRIIEPTGGK